MVPDGWMDGAVTMEAAGGGPAGWCGGALEENAPPGGALPSPRLCPRLSEPKHQLLVPLTLSLDR